MRVGGYRPDALGIQPPCQSGRVFHREPYGYIGAVHTPVSIAHDLQKCSFGDPEHRYLFSAGFKAPHDLEVQVVPVNSMLFSMSETWIVTWMSDMQYIIWNIG